jgi:hypothetical protein
VSSTDAVLQVTRTRAPATRADVPALRAVPNTMPAFAAVSVVAGQSRGQIVPSDGVEIRNIARFVVGPMLTDKLPIPVRSSRS